MYNDKIEKIFNKEIKNIILKKRNINENIIKIEGDQYNNKYLSICLNLTVVDKPEDEVLDNEISLKTLLTEGYDFKEWDNVDIDITDEFKQDVYNIIEILINNNIPLNEIEKYYYFFWIKYIYDNFINDKNREEQLNINIELANQNKLIILNLLKNNDKWLFNYINNHIIDNNDYEEAKLENISLWNNWDIFLTIEYKEYDYYSFSYEEDEYGFELSSNNDKLIDWEEIKKYDNIINFILEYELNNFIK